MKTIGALVEEVLNLTTRGQFEFAFLPACEAFNRTAKEIYQNEASAEPEFQRFIKENWRLISFMGVPNPDSIPANLPFGIRRAVPSLNMPNLAQEIIIYAFRQTLHTRRFPPEIGFHKLTTVQVKEDKLLFPQSLVFAIAACVVFNPINKDEKISELYWLNIRGFQMFITELWGRYDLADRIMDLYKIRR